MSMHDPSLQARRGSLNDPILTPEDWVGVWIRVRSGPNSRAQNPAVQVSVWHLIRDLSGFDSRPRTMCGYGPRYGFAWPSGGARWEVARPASLGLPGEVCARCRTQTPAPSPEIEVVIADEPDLERLADLVMERLTERQKATQEAK